MRAALDNRRGMLYDRGKCRAALVTPPASATCDDAQAAPV